MSELENIEQETAEEVTQEVVKETPKHSREDYDRIQREKASQSGWKDFDDYIADGGDPSKWKTADAFNTYGELIGTVKRKEQEFNQRLEGVQRLAEARIQAEREKLAMEREALIDEGGRAKEVKAIEKQMDALTVQQQRPTTNSALDEWNANNQWVNEDTPKASYARDVFAKSIQARKTVEAAIDAVEAGLKKHYAPAPRATHVPETERGRQSVGFGKVSKVPTMAELTADERLAWTHMGHAWGNDEKKFLQAVADTRKAAKGGN